MKVRISLFLLLVIYTVHVCGQRNLCASSGRLCPGGTRHIACESNGGFGSRCPSNARVVKLSSKMRNMIVKMHNVRRNRVASGNFSKFSAARRMPTLQWNSQLASVATWNAKRCYMAHDRCRNTPRFTRAGQNIGISGTSGMANRVQTHITSTIKGWYAEYRDATMADINNFNNPKKVGHFTQMVSDRVRFIGCGCVRYIQNGRNMLILTCNYSSTNILNNSVYTTGTSASGCTSGRNPNYRNLCSVNENIDVNAI